MTHKVATLMFALALVAPVHGMTITGVGGGGAAPYTGYAPNSYAGTMFLNTVTSIAAGSTIASTYASLLNTQYPPSVPYASATTGAAAGGTFNISAYSLVDLTASVRGTMVATYTPSPLEPNYVWLQVINTNKPKPGYTSPYIDIFAQSPVDGTPFYPIDPSGGGSMKFSDTPERPKPQSVLGDYSTNWSADLFLCSYTPNPNGGMGGGIVIHDGVRWGFSLVSGGPPRSIQAVPEPAAFLGLLPAFLLVTRRRNTAAK